MKKPKYEKPVVKDLSSIQIVQGSCVSGAPEETMVDCTTVGNIALGSCFVDRTFSVLIVFRSGKTNKVHLS